MVILVCNSPPLRADNQYHWSVNYILVLRRLDCLVHSQMSNTTPPLIETNLSWRVKDSANAPKYCDLVSLFLSCSLVHACNRNQASLARLWSRFSMGPRLGCRATCSFFLGNYARHISPSHSYRHCWCTLCLLLLPSCVPFPLLFWLRWLLLPWLFKLLMPQCTADVSQMLP